MGKSIVNPTHELTTCCNSLTPIQEGGINYEEQPDGINSATLEQLEDLVSDHEKQQKEQELFFKQQ
jgi:hypothetical protein